MGKIKQLVVLPLSAIEIRHWHSLDFLPFFQTTIVAITENTALI